MQTRIIAKISEFLGLKARRPNLRARNFPRRNKDDIYRIVKGNAELIAQSRVLIDFAADLVDCISDDWEHPVLIVVGVDRMSAPIGEKRPVIGIQTEHFVDANGQKLWSDFTERQVAIMLEGFTKVLDLSVHNTPLYQNLRVEQQAKLTFGPYIFPYAPVEFVNGGKPPAFFGWMKDRREQFINDLSQKIALEVYPKRTYGRRLQRKIAGVRAILNVHFHPGVYAEAPRLLKAYLAGKPVMTEELGKPFVMGRHVLPITSVPSEEEAKAVFEAFDEEIAMKYRFIDYLRDALELPELPPVCGYRS